MTDHAPRRPSSLTLVGVAAVLLGVGSGVASMRFDGFVMGLFQGAGGMLVVLGVYVIVRFVLRADRGVAGEGWLPSRDGR